MPVVGRKALAILIVCGAAGAVASAIDVVTGATLEDGCGRAIHYELDEVYPVFVDIIGCSTAGGQKRTRFEYIEGLYTKSKLCFEGTLESKEAVCGGLRRFEFADFAGYLCTFVVNRAYRGEVPDTINVYIKGYSMDGCIEYHPPLNYPTAEELVVGSDWIVACHEESAVCFIYPEGIHSLGADGEMGESIRLLLL